MSPHRRPEIWLLIGLVAAGLTWVALDQRRATHEPPPEAPDTSSSTVRDLRITRTQRTPDGAHIRLRIEFTARHGAPHPIDVRSPQVRLLDASGAEVPAFFEPGSFPPSLPPNMTAASWIEFWLTESQAASPLELVVAGRRTAVTLAPPAANGG